MSAASPWNERRARQIMLELRKWVLESNDHNHLITFITEHNKRSRKRIQRCQFYSSCNKYQWMQDEWDDLREIVKVRLLEGALAKKSDWHTVHLMLAVDWGYTPRNEERITHRLEEEQVFKIGDQIIKF